MALNNFTSSSSSHPNNPQDFLNALFTAAHGHNPPDDSTSQIPSCLVNYNEKFASADPVMFRDELCNRLMSVLITKNKPNVALVGAAGVGKTKVVEDVARRIATHDHCVPSMLKEHTIYELPLTALLAGTSLVGALEERMESIITFASDPDNNVILFIDEIHRILNPRGDSQANKIAQILKPPMARGEISVIAATTTGESRVLDDDPAFARRFTRLVVDELSVENTRTILGACVSQFVDHYDNTLTISDDVLDHVVRMSEVHARANEHRPDSTLTLLDRACAETVMEHAQAIAQAQADGNTTLVNILTALPHVPVTRTRVSDIAEKLATGSHVTSHVDFTELRTALHERLQGQDDVLDTVVDEISRDALELFPSPRPLTLMFAGPSGVGKTETAQILAEHLTGSEPIILNMAEYHTQADATKIIGSPPGYVGSTSTRELPFDSLESNPRQVIVLDEFEKSHTDVQRMFLSVFDTGVLVNARGATVDFSRAIIVCTTNAGRDRLAHKPIGFGNPDTTVSHQSLITALEEVFEPELLGRMTKIVGYHPLSAHVYGEILQSIYTRERTRIVDMHPHLGAVLPAHLDSDVIEALTTSTYVESQGARPGRAAIQRWVENTVVNAQAPAPSTP